MVGLSSWRLWWPLGLGCAWTNASCAHAVQNTGFSQLITPNIQTCAGLTKLSKLFLLWGSKHGIVAASVCLQQAVISFTCLSGVLFNTCGLIAFQLIQLPRERTPWHPFFSPPQLLLWPCFRKRCYHLGSANRYVSWGTDMLRTIWSNDIQRQYGQHIQDSSHKPSRLKIARAFPNSCNASPKRFKFASDREILKCQYGTRTPTSPGMQMQAVQAVVQRQNHAAWSNQLLSRQDIQQLPAIYQQVPTLLKPVRSNWRSKFDTHKDVFKLVSNFHHGGSGSEKNEKKKHTTNMQIMPPSRAGHVGWSWLQSPSASRHPGQISGLAPWGSKCLTVGHLFGSTSEYLQAKPLRHRLDNFENQTICKLHCSNLSITNQPNAF